MIIIEGAIGLEVYLDKHGLRQKGYNTNNGHVLYIAKWREKGFQETEAKDLDKYFIVVPTHVDRPLGPTSVAKGLGWIVGSPRLNSRL